MMVLVLVLVMVGHGHGHGDGEDDVYGNDHRALSCIHFDTLSVFGDQVLIRSKTKEKKYPANGPVAYGQSKTWSLVA